MTLKSGLELDCYQSKTGYGFLFTFHSDYMAPSYSISEIKREIGRKYLFNLHSTPPLRGFRRRSIAVPFDTENLEWRAGLPTVKEVWGYAYNRFDRIPACDRPMNGRTDGQTSCDGMQSAITITALAGQRGNGKLVTERADDFCQVERWAGTRMRMHIFNLLSCGLWRLYSCCFRSKRYEPSHNFRFHQQ